MTVVEADPRHPSPGPDPGRNLAMRLWAAPLWAHLAALAVVLLALVGFVGADSVFMGDEGAAAIQARSLAEGDGWVVPHQAPELDPAGRHYPLDGSSVGPKGAAPLAKHPLYAILLAGAYGAGGLAGMVLISVSGTVAAAGLSAALARRIDPALSRPALWVVGLASPLLFDGFVVIAHTLGATAAVAAVLLTVIAIERRSFALAGAVAPVVAVAVLLRNEAIFFALGLAATAAFLAWSSRRLLPLVAGSAALFCGAAAYLLDRLWVRAIVGGSPGVGSSPISSGGGGLVADRIRGFAKTWLTPSYNGSRTVGLLLILTVVLLAVAAMAVRRRPHESRRIVTVGAVAATLAVVAVLVDPDNLVPGLLLAFPVVVPGLLLLRRSSLATTAATLAAGTVAVFAAGVLATQYPEGGTAEWGGRYFALGLPIIIPVLLLALREGGRALDAGTRRALAASLAVCCLALSVMAIGTLRSRHQFNAELAAAIEQAGRQTATEHPVVVTSAPLAPRLGWPALDDQRWLLADDGDLGALITKLRTEGVDRFVFVSGDLAEDRSELAGTAEVSRPFGRADGRGWQVRVLTTV